MGARLSKRKKKTKVRASDLSNQPTSNFQRNSVPEEASQDLELFGSILLQAFLSSRILQEEAGAPAPSSKPWVGAGAPAPSSKPWVGTGAPAPSSKPRVGAGAPAPLSKSRVGVWVPAPSNKPWVGAGAPALKRERQRLDPEEHFYDCVADDCDPGEKCYDPNDPSLIIVDADDDLDFLLEEFKSPRALMSCGHAVTPTSVANWCRKQLDDGESDFMCGAADCDAMWSFEEVRKMALLTPKEVEDFEKKMFHNSKDCYDVKSCPGCKSTVLRNDLDNLCVECPVCTVDLKRKFNFCWQCLKEWQGPSPRGDRCENSGCFDKALETLRNCPEMTFKHVVGVKGCPSVRACPTCGFLVEHDGTGCKNISCSRCRDTFCFVCLKYKEDCIKTRSVYEMCLDGVAPRQTYIAVLSWDDDHDYYDDSDDYYGVSDDDSDDYYGVSDDDSDDYFD